MISVLVGIIARSPFGIQILLYLCAGLLVMSLGLGIEVRIQHAELKAAQARQETLGVELKAQNDGVNEWKIKADQQAQRATDAAQSAEKLRALATERARKLAAAPVPADCRQAIAWGAGQALEFNRQWTQDGPEGGEP